MVLLQLPFCWTMSYSTRNARYEMFAVQGSLGPVTPCLCLLQHVFEGFLHDTGLDFYKFKRLADFVGAPNLYS